MILIVALAVLVVVDWIAVALLTGVIRRAHREGTKLPAAVDRRRAAGAIATGSTLLLLWSINRQIGSPVTGDLVTVVAILAVFVPSLANLLFLLDVLRGVYR
jgi:hypothetical protein